MSLILPVFYTFRRCPYAMRARLALIVSGTKVELREILLRDKPHSFLESSPSATVPCLKLSDEHILDESLDIMLWALRQNDLENWLEPPLGNLEQMLSLIDEMDGDFKRNLDRYKYSTRYDGAVAAEHRQIAFSLLLPLEDRLAETSHLFGNRVTLADMAIAPFVRQFANTDREWFDAQPVPNIQRWLSTFISSEIFETCMEKFPVWNEQETGLAFPRQAA